MPARSLKISAILELRDKLSAGMAKASGSVKAFSASANTHFGRAGQYFDTFVSKTAQGTKKITDWFGAKALSLWRTWAAGIKISAAIGAAALGSFFLGGINQATNFQDTLRQATGLLTGDGATSAQADRAYAQYSKAVLDMAPKVAKSPQDLAESMYDIVSGGYGDPKDVSTILHASALGASAGSSDTKTVANALVKILRSYNMDAKDATKVTDFMFQAVNKGIISFEEMSSGIGNVVGMAAAAKVPFKELTAAIEVMTLRGLGSEEAFTSLNQVMMTLASPSQTEWEAAQKVFGSDASKKQTWNIQQKIDDLKAQKDAVDSAGKFLNTSAQRRVISGDISSLKKQLEDMKKNAKSSVEDMWGPKALATKGLSGVMQGLRERLALTPTEQKQLAGITDDAGIEAFLRQKAGGNIEALTGLFGNVRALRGALLLAAPEGTTFSDALKDMDKSAGATNRTMKEQRKSFRYAKDELKSYLDVLKINIGSAILPGLSKAAKRVSNWVKTEIIDNPEFQKADTGGKFKIIGEKIWDAITSWWEDHKVEVSAKITEGLDWLGSVATPKAVSMATELGKAIVPAIVKGMTKSPYGNLLMAYFGISLGAKGVERLAKGAGAGGGVGGAGGAGGVGGVPVGGGGSGLASKLIGGTVLASTIYLSAKAVYQSWSDFGSDLDKNGKALGDKYNNATPTEQLGANKTAREGKGGISDIAVQLRGKQTANDVAMQHSADNLQNRWWKLAQSMGLSYNRTGDMIEAAKSALSELKDERPETWKVAKKRGLTTLRSAPDVFKLRDFLQEKLGSHSAINRNFDTKLAGISDGYARAIELGKKNALSSIDAAQEQKGVIADSKTMTQNVKDNLTSMTNAQIGAAWIVIKAYNDVTSKFTMTREQFNDAKGRAENLAGGAYSTDDWKYKPQGWDRSPGKPTGKKQANGGFGTVTKPTWFLAGESGTEDFAFMPRGVRGSKFEVGGGTSLNFHAPLIGQANLKSDADVEQVAGQLAKAIGQAVQNGAR